MTNPQTQLNDFHLHWLYKKHGKHIEPIYFENAMAFWLKASEKGNFPLEPKESDEELILNWKNINPHYSFYFDYVNCENEISLSLSKSILSSHKNIFIEFGWSDSVLLLIC